MSELCVLGIDLGTRKSGICWIMGRRIQALRYVNAGELVAVLEHFRQEHGAPDVVVIDVPIDARWGKGFRLVDRVFMRGLFNNNHTGLQPNNPDLLDLAATLGPVRAWCDELGARYCNRCPIPQQGVLLETMPNVALGMLCDPQELIEPRRRLRFRYGRGKNVAQIVTVFECLQGTAHGFFTVMENPPLTWAALAECAKDGPAWQSDDLIAALTCGTLAWWCRHTGEVGYIREEHGHYLLPPPRLVHPTWREELRKILGDPLFENLQTN